MGEGGREREGARDGGEGADTHGVRAAAGRGTGERARRHASEGKDRLRGGKRIAINKGEERSDLYSGGKRGALKKGREGRSQ